MCTGPAQVRDRPSSVGSGGNGVAAQGAAGAALQAAAEVAQQVRF